MTIRFLGAKISVPIRSTRSTGISLSSQSLMLLGYTLPGFLEPVGNDVNIKVFPQLLLS